MTDSENAARVGRRKRLRALLFAGALAVTAAAVYARVWLSTPRPRPRNVILMVLDALPASRLGCYGYVRDIDGVKTSLTPNIDALAETGTLFENCYSQSNWTATSVASMLYSLNPTIAGSRHSFDYLGAAGPNHCLFQTVPQENIETDYERIAVVANPYLLDDPFTSIFDLIVNVVPRPFRESNDKLLGREAIHGDAATVNSHAFGTIRYAKGRGRGFLMYLHYMDVHEPYPWRGGYRELFPDGATQAEDFGSLRGDVPAAYAAGGSTGRYDDETAERIRRLSNDYDASLMYLDSRIGELVAFLKDNHLLEDTLIIVAADHGQQFGEHGNIGHCQGMYDEETHVPLVMAGGGMPAGVRARTIVRNIDIAPTIEEYVDIRTACDGESLYPVAEAAARNETSPNREVFACSDFPPDVHPDIMKKMLVSKGLKYVRTKNADGEIIAEELYDMAADRGERHNLSASQPEALAAMRARTNEISSRAVASSSPAPATSSAPAVRERLRSIGYFQ